MANLSEQSIWEAGVYQIEENDPVHGGANGITNRPTKQLANRTVWLKNELASSVQAINANLTNLSNNKADKTLNLVAGNGLTGGGTLQANRTLTLGTPSQITASSTNSVTATSHTHAIDKASTTVAGIVQLVDNLITNDNAKALTAAQGKALNDKLTATDAKADTKVNRSGDVMTGHLQLRYTNDWVGYSANNPTEGKNGYYDVAINNIARGGMQVVSRGNGRYDTIIGITPAGATNTERRVGGLAVSEDGLYAHAYGALHEYFVKTRDNQTINGVKTFSQDIVVGTSNGWGRIAMPLTDGTNWIIETNPRYKNASAGQPALRFNHNDGSTRIFYDLPKSSKSETLAYQSWVQSANVASATKLQNPRNIAMTGDGSWNVNFDGSANASGTLTLANSGVTAGSYNSVTVDAKGRVTRGLSQVHGLITATTATGTANQATTNTNTYLNIVASGVGSTASVGSSTQVTGTNGISISSDTAGKLIISRDSNSPTATRLQTPRTISLTGAVTGSVSFNGSANVSIATTLNLADFANSKTENGYQKLPNGLIIQWGDKINHEPVVFPIAFPNKVLNVSLTLKVNSRDSDSMESFGVNSVSNTGFSIFNWVFPSQGCYWLAIGY